MISPKNCMPFRSNVAVCCIGMNSYCSLSPCTYVHIPHINKIDNFPIEFVSVFVYAKRRMLCSVKYYVYRHINDLMSWLIKPFQVVLSEKNSHRGRSSNKSVGWVYIIYSMVCTCYSLTCGWPIANFLMVQWLAYLLHTNIMVMWSWPSP
jgi:hypothetical protein